MKSFEQVFRALEKLFDHSVLVYFERTKKDIDPESEKWLQLAGGIDHAARDLIGWCIAMASVEPLERERKWLTSEIAQKLDDGDVRVAKMLARKVGVYVRLSGEEGKNGEAAAKEMRTRLDALLTMSRRLRDEIDKSLGTQPVKRPRKLKRHPSKGS